LNPARGFPARAARGSQLDLASRRGRRRRANPHRKLLSPPKRWNASDAWAERRTASAETG